MSSRWGLSGTTPVNASGTPYPLGTINFYVTGTTTPTDTFSDAGLTSANSNPYTLGSDGEIGEIFISQVRTKAVLKDAAGNTLRTWDPIDKSLEEISASSAPSPTYPSLRWIDTSTSPAHRKRRDSTNATWIDEGPVDSVGNAASVAQQIAGTSAVVFSTPASEYGLWGAGGAVTITTNNISLPAGGGGYFTCASATTTLTTISSTTDGREVEVIFANAQTITHGSGINTIGSVTYNIPAGARIRFRRGASDWTIIWQRLSARYARIAQQIFTATGNYTRTDGTAATLFEAVGGGGSGAGCTSAGSQAGLASGGGAGQFASLFKTSPALTYAITIGTAAAGATTAANGTDGTDVTVGAILTAHGGKAGINAATSGSGGAQIGGAGGTGATSGDWTADGQQGGTAYRGASGAAPLIGGDGGHSRYGFGGRGALSGTSNSQTNGSAGTGYGAGGGGGQANGTGGGTGNGGAATAGLVIATEFAMV